ncbi:fungal-specific transcription factor domain-containing protein [Staphylotrichum tortipilum]|uniref:Fungal-specific transcription factor domain-containing protein n=1 Tax=Staphylotrichum tortipilum TaxID=2831512 RepID=A0AAN6MH55_9PEZI|nr:fungal-specific transcription factor domain-containing protein [Staphylotrichum longicolle]
MEASRFHLDVLTRRSVDDSYSAAKCARDDHTAKIIAITKNNKPKSGSACNACRLRRPGCRTCSQRGSDCPGYPEQLKWSTTNEWPTPANTRAPVKFTQLVAAASENIVSKPAGSTADSGPDGASPLPMAPVPAHRLTVPSISLSASPRSPSSSPSPSSQSSPLPQDEEPATSAESRLDPVSSTTGPELGWPKEDQAPDMILSQPVVDIQTFLINHWFTSVCPSWSALDSPTNPYRRLTAELWQSSPPVFHALQSISAASLVERLPHVIKDTARQAPRDATEAIKKEFFAVFTHSRPKFPTEMLLSLFCMSSSMCWIESHQLGQQFVRQARAVLKKLEGWNLDSETQELLDFFNGCLVYEEMLRSVVSKEEIDFEHMLSWPEPVAPRSLLFAVSHPWTGVSSDVLRLFGKATALCRRSRTRWRHNVETSYRILDGAMKDIEEATKVEEALRSVTVPPLPAYGLLQPDHDPDRARALHHLSEAYRLCALLQLYEAFPDLNHKTQKDTDGPYVWHSWVTQLALHVVDLLGKVPSESMSCLQPLLCLCAGSGLRRESKAPMGGGQHESVQDTDLNTTGMPTPVPSHLLGSNGVSENTIKVLQARQAVMARLDQLEINLPPKPIGVAKQLQRAVWSAYDDEIGLTRRTHWMDVMSYTGLHSIFR